MTAFSIASADIAHQRVDDEVIVINLATGAYFSLRDAAADAWELLIGGHPQEVAADALATRFGVPASTVGEDLAAFASALLSEGLLATADAGGPAVMPPFEGPVGGYSAPRLEKFDDLEELLLLDPIHEVDEAGWPVIAVEPFEQ